MTPKPLDQIRLRWSDHSSALWWLGLLYRKPREFREGLQACPGRRVTLLATTGLVLHILPYVILAAIAGRLVLFGVLGTATQTEFADLGRALFYHARVLAFGVAAGTAYGIVFGAFTAIGFGMASGIAIGIISGVAFATEVGIAYGVAAQLTSGVVAGILSGIAVGIAVGVAQGIAIGTAFGLTLGILVGFAISVAYGVALGVASGLAVALAYGVAFAISVLRCYYHVAHLFFVWPRIRGAWYPYHPVAWDDLCRVPFARLDELLTAYAEQKPVAGIASMERLIFHYPSQRQAGLRAWTRLRIRDSARVDSLARIGEVLASLPVGEQGFLRDVPTVRSLVGEIVALQTRVDAADRTILKEPYAAALCTEIENVRHNIAGLREPLRSELRPAVEQWQTLAERQRDDLRRVLKRAPTPQLFRAGDPVNRESEAFVPRDRVVGRLEEQVMLATGCPGIVLYGRRRMGKSTVLRNLDGFLPPSVITAVFSMQNPEAHTSLELFCELVARMLMLAGSGGHASVPSARSLLELGRRLTAADVALEKAGRRLVLAIDEYELIDAKIGQGVFPEDLLVLVRDSIQTHRNLTWAFAGSHAIDELTAAPWTSYLVSARTVEVPPFTEAETRLLLTEPLRSSRLWRGAGERPRFAPEFWGERGIERLHDEAGGWPHLVQLLAQTVVDLVNEAGASEVDDALWARALAEAVERGHNVLFELTRRECRSDAEWDYLSAFRRSEVQPPPSDDVARALKRRLLVAVEGDAWRLRVPLMRRWLIERA